jgi:hypothetical protein
VIYFRERAGAIDFPMIKTIKIRNAKMTKVIFYLEAKRGADIFEMGLELISGRFAAR